MANADNGQGGVGASWDYSTKLGADNALTANEISIARTLLKDPPILILDEATSALDAITEAKVQAALDEAMAGRTTFVIAHRLATVRHATRILLFENGEIVEAGSFDQLVPQGGRFAKLAHTQFMAMAPQG